MKSMNCRNVRSEIEEAAAGNLLSPTVNEHLMSCVACETLLREQTSLRALVASLGTVEAPGDFDFRLRARLAGEKRGLAQPFALGSFSFGFRSAIVATLLLLVGSALMFVSFKTRSGDSLSPGVATNKPKVAPDQTEVTTKHVETVATEGAPGSQPGDGSIVKAGVSSPAGTASPSPRRRGLSRPELAGLRDLNRQRTRDLSSSPAPVLKRDQLAEVYPAAAFSLAGGYQSLKVSLDDGHGISRTISLPTVSFGSQRSLSQGASPLMASARGAW